MGWSYPKISFEDFMNLIKSYVDLLLLASGYQSTGLVANWDSENIKKSLQWALFLEEVSKGLLSSADYEDSVEELDSLLYELTLDPNFPQDLAQLSCITLCRARDLMLEHLIHTFPMRESHLKAIMIASLEMDNSTVPSKERDNWEDGDFSVATIQQLKKRKLAVSCSSAAEAGLENIWKTLRQRTNDELCSTSNSDQLKHFKM